MAFREDDVRSWVPSAGILLAIVGLIVATTPVFTGSRGLALMNAVVVGLLLIGFGVFTLWTASKGRPARAVWPGRITVALGIWIILSPFLLGAPLAHLLTMLMLAPFVIFLGAYVAYKAPGYRTSAARRGRAA